MYGFLKIPSTASLADTQEYRKYMCVLCDALHENYGIRGRLFTNYDMSSLALIIGALDRILSLKLPESPKYLCFRPLKYKKTPHIFKFLSSISVMLAYSKFLDNAIENNKKIPKWIDKLSNLASTHLVKYGLDKSFFENVLYEQHKLEENSNNIETLSIPTSQIISKILFIAGKLSGKPEYSEKFKELGLELGKLIYIYDGLSDYYQDLKTGSFNCVYGCYVKQNSNLEQVSERIYDFIENIKNNISTILNSIEFKQHTKLISEILLQDIVTKENKYEKSNLNKLKIAKTFCKTWEHNKLTKQAIYGILTSVLMVRTAEAQAETPIVIPEGVCAMTFLACCCLGCYGYLCGGGERYEIRRKGPCEP